MSLLLDVRGMDGSTIEEQELPAIDERLRALCSKSFQLREEVQRSIAEFPAIVIEGW